MLENLKRIRRELKATVAIWEHVRNTLSSPNLDLVNQTWHLSMSPRGLYLSVKKVLVGDYVVAHSTHSKLTHLVTVHVPWLSPCYGFRGRNQDTDKSWRRLCFIDTCLRYLSKPQTFSELFRSSQYIPIVCVENHFKKHTKKPTKQTLFLVRP